MLLTGWSRVTSSALFGSSHTAYRTFANIADELQTIHTSLTDALTVFEHSGIYDINDHLLLLDEAHTNVVS